MTDTTRKEPFEGHKKLEKNVTLLGAATLLVVAIGGIVEIAPLFWIDNTIEKVEGMRPYTPLEQAGGTSTSAKAATPATAR
jgi:cytochrome c oxidase cbb3-type subunit 2